MPEVCARPCGRLATAAIFISVGVVQLVAGLILVRSQYVYLLSAPNFWTAASNFAVGGLLGISASVWKEMQKESPKHTARRALLASLVLSSLLMNGTTAAILVLGEGNALLSIKLESGEYSDASLASELKAYAYATSVCSPIVCIVVACIFLSGLCFRRLEKNVELKNTTVLNEDDGYAYSWVFRPKLGRLPRADATITRKRSTRFLSSSTDDDDSLMSPETTLHRSNSLPSAEGSLLNATRILRTRSDNNIVLQTSHEPNTTDGKYVYLSRDKSKVSFVNESLKGGRSLPRHFAVGRRSNQELYRARSNDTAFEASKRYQKSVSKMRTKHLDKDSHVGIASGRKADHYKELLRLQSRPDYQLLMERSAGVADIRMDMENFESNKIFDCNNSEEESTLVYEADSSSSDVFVRFQNDHPPYEKSKIRRTSTVRSLKSLEAMDRAKDGHKTINRTSTAINSRSPDEFQSMEDSKCTVSNVGQTESSITLRKSPFNNLSYSSVKLPKKSYIVDDPFDSPTTSHLAGEMIPIQVSTFPRKISSKLIPVSIPAVSSNRKYPLKTIKSSDNRYLKNKHENRRRASSVVRTSKFHAVGEPKLLSFKGGIKTNAKENRSHKVVALPRKKAVVRSDPEMPPEPTTSRRTEDSVRENGCSSPAHTSGYMSALEDTLDSSSKSRSTETSFANQSTFEAGSSTGQTHHRPTSDGWNSQKVQSSLGCNAVKEVLKRADGEGESSSRPSKEKLIDQLLNDPSFLNLMMQSLKETEV